jgi:hypothetical protein
MMIELLQLRPATPVEPDTEYDDALHDVNAIIMDLCAALDDTGAFEFRVSGFGDERWPVDVGIDLATVLEQLPKALRAAHQGHRFEIGFYEQGLQRELHFCPRGKSCEVRCVSTANWIPVPEVEVMQLELALDMLVGLKKHFCELCDRLLPRTSAHPWFREYARS